MENKSLSIPKSYRFGIIGSPDAFNKYDKDGNKTELIKKYEEQKTKLVGTSVQPKNQYAYDENTFHLHNDFFIVDFDYIDGLSLRDLLSYNDPSIPLKGDYSSFVDKNGYLFFTMWDKVSLPLSFRSTYQEVLLYQSEHRMITKHRCHYLCLFDTHTIDDLDQTINEFVASQLLKDCDKFSATNIRRAEAFIDKYTGYEGPELVKKQ